MPTPDAGAAAAAYRIVHPTCGSATLDNPAGRAAVRGGSEIICTLDDAGVAWRLAAGGNEAQRLAYVYSDALHQDALLEPARLGLQLRLLDADARRTNDNAIASAGMLFRAPERMHGRIVRIEGIARDVREVEGETLLTVAEDILGRERIEVTYSGVASDSVVNGARVIVHAISVGSHTAHTVLGDQVVPEVLAVYVGTPAEIAALERLPPPRAQSEQPAAPSGRHGGRHHRHGSSG